MRIEQFVFVTSLFRSWTSVRVRWKLYSRCRSPSTLSVRVFVRCRSPTRTTPGNHTRSYHRPAWGVYYLHILSDNHFLSVFTLSVCASWRGWWRPSFFTERSGRREEPTGAGPGWEEEFSPSTRTGEQEVHHTGLQLHCNIDVEMQSNIGTTAFAENSFSISHLEETFHIVQGSSAFRKTLKVRKRSSACLLQEQFCLVRIILENPCKKL